MGEKVTSDFQLRKCARKEQLIVDRISQFPNEILVYILSFLTLEDAARTSVLSKRWVDLWLSVTRLDFDSAKMWEGIPGINEMSKYVRLRKRNRRKYVKWVNKVLQSHKAIVLDVFRIRFDLNKSSKNNIDKWLQYVFARRVHRLDLNLSDYDDEPCYDVRRAYAFPGDLLGLSNGNSSAVSLSDSCGNGISSDALFGFKSLRTLTFNNVNVSGDVLEYFLHNCPLLEHLGVESSETLKHLKVCGPSLALKHLEIIYCPDLLSLTVCDTDIVSLKVTQGHRLVLKNVPMLVDVYIAGRALHVIRAAISWLSCCQSKLEVLTLQINNAQLEMEALATNVALPQFTKLKQLTFVVYGPEDDSLIPFTSLIMASPNLEKFALKFDRHSNIAREHRASKKGLAFPLQHLKVVELCGYYGLTAEVELVEYFVENAVALEKIIIDPRDRPLEKIMTRPLSNPPLIIPGAEAIYRNLAKQQLEGLVPSRVELVLL